MPMRSFVVGKSIMPKIANIVSGKTSDVSAPARAAAVSLAEPGVEAPLGVNASGPDAAEALGHRQHAEHTHEQDRALHEQGRPVDGEGEQLRGSSRRR